jgi:hypothetical protein
MRIRKTECKNGKSHKVEETDERGFYDNELEDIDTFIYTIIQSMKNVDKLMNSDTRVKVVHTGLTQCAGLTKQLYP